MDATTDISICHILAFDNRGGAGQAVSQIHEGLKSRGVGSKILCLESTRFSDQVVNVKKTNSCLRRIAFRIFKNWNKKFKNLQLNPTMFEIFSDISSPYQNLWDLIPDGTNLVQLNWASYILDWPSFFGIQPKMPIVWRLADVNPLTGGCHYAGDCVRFSKKCVDCPQIASRRLRKRVCSNFEAKEKLLDALNTDSLYLVAQSKWMEDQIRISRLFSRFPTVIIRNGVDKNVFHEKPMVECRKFLGVPCDPVVGLIFCNGGLPRKGTRKLLDRLAKTKNSSLHLLLVGNDIHHNFESLTHTKLNAMPKSLLPVVYSAASFLIFPSMQDNCPNTVLESQACGTPVLCFSNSGTAELVSEQQNGWLIPDGNFEHLLSKIISLVESKNFPARDLVAKNVNSATDMIEQYHSLYRTILSGGIV